MSVMEWDSALKLDRLKAALLAPVRGEHALMTVFVASCLIYFLLFVMGAPLTLRDPDVLWHIRSGQLILQTRSFPVVDAWSYTETGKPWLAKEWLSQVIYALTFRAAGWNGVAGVASAAIALAFGLLAWFSMQRYPKWLVYALLASAFVLASSHILTRPHVLCYPLLVVWFAGLSRASDEGRAPTLWLLPVMLLWVNMHGGFTLGLVYAVGFAVCTVWEAQGDRRALALGWARFVGIALLCALANPYGYEAPLITIKLFGFGQNLATIVEWMAPDFARDKGVLVIVLGWIALALSTRPRISPPRVLLVLALLYLFFTATRNSELLGFAMPFLVPAMPGRRPGAKSVSLREWTKLAAVGLSAVIASVAAAVVMRPALAPAAGLLPTQCLAYARAQGLLGKRMLNAYEFGGYLISENVPTYIDGRAELFGSERLREYYNFQYVLADDPLFVLDRDRIDWTMLNPLTPVSKVMDGRPGWTRAFAGDNCLVHVRTGK